MAKKRKRPRPHRFSAYRPVIDRLIFGVALLGMLVVVHLGIQQKRGFDQGCFGLAGTPAEASFNCAAVLGSEASAFLGVSNVVWGFLFYTAVAGLSFAAALSAGKRLRRLKLARAALIGVGVLYSAYLVYVQLAQIGALCALCLVSAGLVAALAVLQAFDFFMPTPSVKPAMSAKNMKREAVLFASLVALVVVLGGADVAYFSTLPAQTAAPSLAADTMEVADGCFYNTEKAPVENPNRLIGMGDAVEGTMDAPVTVIEYFDPNCPHCATFHPVMKQLQEEYGDQARFVYKPLPLWQYSVPQIEALYAAGQEGKFEEMLQAQYANQQQGGLSMEELRAIARQIGMDPDVLTARLRQGLYRPRLMQTRQQAVEIGLESTPTVLINGRFVAQRSRTPRCLSAMIEAAAEEAGASSR